MIYAPPVNSCSLALIGVTLAYHKANYQKTPQFQQSRFSLLLFQVTLNNTNGNRMCKRCPIRIQFTRANYSLFCAAFLLRLSSKWTSGKDYVTVGYSHISTQGMSTLKTYQCMTSALTLTASLNVFQFFSFCIFLGKTFLTINNDSYTKI